MRTGKLIGIVGAVLASALVLAACRAEEQGRVIRYQKGTYLGKPDTALSGAQLKNLRDRSSYQGSRTAL